MASRDASTAEATNAVARQDRFGGVPARPPRVTSLRASAYLFVSPTDL